MTETITGRCGESGSRMSFDAKLDGARKAGKSARSGTHASLPCMLVVVL